MNIEHRILLIILSVLVLFSSCSAPVKKESPINNAVTFCSSGFQKLYTGDYKTAETEFLKALELDNNLYLGYTGMAFLELQRSNNSTAISYSDKAIDACPDSAEGYAIKAAAIAILKKGSNWSEKAEQFINRAVALNPENEIVLYCEGVYYFETGKYQHALDSFSECAGKKGGLVTKADEMKQLTGKLITVLPVTEHGLKVVRKSKINRADLSILIIEELKIKQLLKEKRPELFNSLFNDDFKPKNKIKLKIDSVNGRVRECIAETIALDIPNINLFPDGNFYPERSVTRAMIAVIAEGVSVLINDDPSILSRYTGLSSEFSDVNSGYYAFNAIKYSTDKGIIESPFGGTFNPDGEISGIDALLMIRSLCKLFE